MTTRAAADEPPAESQTRSVSMTTCPSCGDPGFTVRQRLFASLTSPVRCGRCGTYAAPDVSAPLRWIVALADQALFYGGLIAGFWMWSLVPVVLGTAASIVLLYVVRWQRGLASVTAAQVTRARRARAIFVALFLFVVVVAGMSGT
jgi:hypothetical protein